MPFKNQRARGKCKACGCTVLQPACPGCMQGYNGTLCQYWVYAGILWYTLPVLGVCRDTMVHHASTGCMQGYNGAPCLYWVYNGAPCLHWVYILYNGAGAPCLYWVFEYSVTACLSWVYAGIQWYTLPVLGVCSDAMVHHACTGCTLYKVSPCLYWVYNGTPCLYWCMK